MDVPDRALPTAHYTGVPQESREKKQAKRAPDAARTAQNTPIGRLKKAHFHALKHTCGTPLLSEQHESIVDVQKHLGHADIRNTMI